MANKVKSDTRNGKGQFAVGNPGGPGRPRRAIELDYLRRLSERVTMADWDEIIDSTIRRAKRGDQRATEFLARYLLGDPAAFQLPSLTALAAHELDGVDPAQEAIEDAKPTDLDKLLKNVTRGSKT